MENEYKAGQWILFTDCLGHKTKVAKVLLSQPMRISMIRIQEHGVRHSTWVDKRDVIGPAGEMADVIYGP